MTASASPIWPIAHLVIDEAGQIAFSKLYAPGLPHGPHDLYPAPVDGQGVPAAMLDLRGELLAIGDMQGDELADLQMLQIAGAPRATFRRDDGRFFTVVGLTQDECRKLAPGFASTFAIQFSEPA